MRKYKGRLWVVCLLYGAAGACLALALPERADAWPVHFAQFVESAGRLFPSIEKFARLSAFPAVTRAYFAVMLTAGPIVMLVGIVRFPFVAYRVVCARRRDGTPLQLIAGVVVSVLAICLLYVFPGAPSELIAIDETAPSVLALVSSHRLGLGVMGGVWIGLTVYIASLAVPITIAMPHSQSSMKLA
jgi:hypothetical protein